MAEQWSTQMTVLLSPDQRDEILRLAREQQRSTSSVIREAVASLLADRSEAVAQW